VEGNFLQNIFRWHVAVYFENNGVVALLHTFQQVLPALESLLNNFLSFIGIVLQTFMDFLVICGVEFIINHTSHWIDLSLGEPFINHIV